MEAHLSPGNIRRLCKWGGVGFALVTGIAAADGAPCGRFAAWAIGLPDGYVIMEYQAPVVQVTVDDAARGVVEVRGGSRLVIMTRTPAGYAVDFYTHGRLFQSVQIDGIGNAVALGATGGTVVRPRARHHSRDLCLAVATDRAGGENARPSTSRHRPSRRDAGRAR